jgi:hypothetical protein
MVDAQSGLSGVLEYGLEMQVMCTIQVISR